jgi:hypothetical protein
MIIPPPVVVDADVLIRNVEYAVRHGRLGALPRYASTGFATTSGALIFASVETGDEVFRHLGDVADRRQVDLSVAHGVWHERIAPSIRFVSVSEDLIDDPRIGGTDEKDRHTARLACLLAPAVLATDNRKHYKPFGLDDTKTDVVAKDLATLGDFALGAKGAAAVPLVTGSLVIDGSNKVIEKLGRGDALLIAALLLGGLILILRTERGRVMRARLGYVAAEVAPKLVELTDTAYAAGDRVHAVAIDRVAEPNATMSLARWLAIDERVMTTAEIAEWLATRSYRFKKGRNHRTETRAWLLRTPCFEEVARGRWTLGHPLVLLPELEEKPS